MAPASGATTKIGAVAEIAAGSRPTEPSNGGDTVQTAEASGTYAVPAGYGVITAWEHSTGSAGGTPNASNEGWDKGTTRPRTINSNHTERARALPPA